MKLSDVLYKRAEPLWREALEEPFLVELATGTLDPRRFRHYMMQDYRYLLGYMDILREMRNLAPTPALQTFLDAALQGTQRETERVHVPAMERLGISQAEMQSGETEDVIGAYLSYMESQLEEAGLLAGLTALLQCSWHYAYVGQQMTQQYGTQIAASPYGDWFTSYGSAEYAAGNRQWIHALDQAAAGIDAAAVEPCAALFVTCAKFELQFWKRLSEI